jgi:acetyl esterase
MSPPQDEQSDTSTLDLTCDEQLKEHLARKAQVAGGRWFQDMTISEARDFHDELWKVDVEGAYIPRPVCDVYNETIAFGDDEIRIRIYRPSNENALPVVVFLHGGGWVLGDIDSHEPTARMICHDANVVVAAVDYLRAPEAKFPLPLESCVAGTAWVKDNIDRYGGNDARIILMGDSSGGNLAAAATFECVESLGESLIGQVLLYAPLVHPDFAQRAGVPLFETRDQTYGPTMAAMTWYWNHYLSDHEEGADPRASPLLAQDLSQLPPTLIGAGKLDTLCVEGVEYGRRLREAGVPVQVFQFGRMGHGFMSHGWIPEGLRSDRAYEAAMEVCTAINLMAWKGCDS